MRLVCNKQQIDILEKEEDDKTNHIDKQPALQSMLGKLSTNTPVIINHTPNKY